MQPVFFGVVLPAVLAALGYVVLKHSEGIANFTSPIDTDRGRGYNLLGVWAGGLSFLVVW
ncbi:MAG: hypothetical protein KKA32_15080 [Actinobacteria bacterium]|nr:hypothetical protein [Actinomycetota bacterium]